MVIESIPSAAGMAYAIIATIIVVILFRKGSFSKRIGYVFLSISTLFGFLVFAPMLPYQLQAVVLGNTKQLGAPLPIAIIFLVLFIALSFAFGRAFCGYICPIGTLQELIYHLPVKKVRIKSKTITIAFRLVSLVVFLVLASVSSVGILKYLGIRDFFYLNATSVFFYIFLTLLIVAVFAYRPFCRFLCPYGALLSLAAIKSRFRLRRNDDCNECGNCEDACPTGEAGKRDLKQK